MPVHQLPPKPCEIESAQAAARAAADLARQMLAFSGRSRMQLTRMDLARFVRDQLAEMRADVPPTVEVVVHSGDRPPVFLADADQIRQTVHNLVRNAIEAVQDVDQAHIEISTSVLEYDAAMLELSRVERKPEPGWFVALDVVDNGSGMADETQRRMFEPFFTTRFAGRGLGLAVVMGVVRAHHGALFVRSRPGHGTSVRVLFPAARSGPEPSATPTPPSPSVAEEAAPSSSMPPTVTAPRSDRPLALLIDDDPFVRLVFTRMAPLIGLDLVAAETGEDAVRMFQPRASDFSIVILDLTLPGMSGWDCHDLLRALRPDIPVIIASGTATDGSAREFAGRKVAGVLPKPFTIEGLTQTLQAVGLKLRPR